MGWADALFKPKRGALPSWPQGFGIIFDDLVAAVCVLVVWFALDLLPVDWWIWLHGGGHLQGVPANP